MEERNENGVNENEINEKKMNEEVELEIQSIGFTFLILLSLYVSFNDVVKLF